MATTDSELIAEARQLTGYTDGNVISDSDFQSLLDVCKQEVRAELGDPSFTFFETSPEDTLQADRALFWFLCIAAKIRTGEIGGMDIDIAHIRTDSPDEEEYRSWFSNFDKRMGSAEARFSTGSGPSQVSPQRDGRSYGESFDVSIREP